MEFETTVAESYLNNNNENEDDTIVFIIVLIILFIIIVLAFVWSYRRVLYLRRLRLTTMEEQAQNLIEKETPLSSGAASLNTSLVNADTNNDENNNKNTYEPITIEMNTRKENTNNNSDKTTQNTQNNNDIQASQASQASQEPKQQQQPSNKLVTNETNTSSSKTSKNNDISIVAGNNNSDNMFPISTSYDTSIVHNVVNVPGITITNITGDIINDIESLWNEILILALNENENKKITYKDAITKDKHFGYRTRVLTRKNTHYIEGSDPLTTKAVTNQDELALYKLYYEEFSWKSKDGAVVGAHLINRLWMHHFEKVPKSSLSESKGFTVMQFNMLADGVSGGYLDTSLDTMRSKDIELSVWEDKCEKSFLKVNELCLQWRYRGLRLIEEILRYKCDIVCIEECDQSDWMYQCYLQNYGYSMIFQTKIDSPNRYTTENYLNSKKKIEFEVESNRFYDTMAKIGKNDENTIKKWKLRNDGCCILFNNRRFEIIGGSDSITKLNSKEDVTQWINNNNNDNNDSISVQCSVMIDLIDKSKPIMSENDDGSVIGYEKLLVYDKKGSKKAGKDVYKDPKVATTFVALHMRDVVLDKEFLLVGTHAKSTKSAEGEKMRVGQLEAIFGFGPFREDLSDTMEFKPIIKNPNNLPILLCCDLNAKSHDTMKFDENATKLVKDYGCECYDTITRSMNDNNGFGFESMYKIALNNKEPIWTTWKERIRLKESDKYENKDENNRKESKSSLSLLNEEIERQQRSAGDKSKHTIDYIFSKGNAWTITHHLDIPDSSQDLGKALLPDWHYPSDHFSLAMRLQWKD